ncbi:uncharacterized protein LOC134246291 [Saccostrea cucullata]|uniref:uncharacterized protein LOC134246291 n=1 Tax=Saccostrea cuccullata TaxID=36930 RepID=UPI002ED1E705
MIKNVAVRQWILKMDEMAECKGRLREIALSPDPLSAVDHIDQMIQAEEISKQVGYEQRIQMLNEFKQLAQTDQSVENFGQIVRKAKDALFKTTGRKVVQKAIPRLGRRKSMSKK